MTWEFSYLNIMLGYTVATGYEGLWKGSKEEREGVAKTCDKGILLKNF